MKDDRKYTEAHVTLLDSNVRSTFRLNNESDMKCMQHMVAGYVADQYAFTVTYS